MRHDMMINEYMTITRKATSLGMPMHPLVFQVIPFQIHVIVLFSCSLLYVFRDHVFIYLLVYKLHSLLELGVHLMFTYCKNKVLSFSILDVRSCCYMAMQFSA